MKARSTLRDITVALAAICVTSALLVSYVAPKADAGHEPANKTAAAGSDIDAIEPNGAHVVLEDTIRVSSSQDAIISVSSECSILTSLITGDDEQTTGNVAQDSAHAFGQVEMHVLLDGKRVPVTYTDTGNQGGPEDAEPTSVTEPGSEGTGEVVFCNRAYQRTVQDRDAANDDDEGGPCPADDPATPEDESQECEGDIDVERDYISTRTANAFNWLAKDIGFDYDDPANGNNIVLVQLVAEYEYDADDPSTPDVSEMQCPTAEGEERTCSEAYVGSRTMIVEPTNVAIHEWVTQNDGEGN